RAARRPPGGVAGRAAGAHGGLLRRRARRERRRPRPGDVRAGPPARVRGRRDRREQPRAALGPGAGRPGDPGLRSTKEKTEMRFGYHANAWGGVVGHPVGVTSIKDLFYLTPGDTIDTIGRVAAAGWSGIELFD